jgi:hypothetical protein
VTLDRQCRWNTHECRVAFQRGYNDFLFGIYHRFAFSEYCSGNQRGSQRRRLLERRYSSSFPDWLEVDFNGNKSISEIDVFSVQDNFTAPVEPTQSTTASLYGLRDFEVQYWTGFSWAPVPGGTITGNHLAWRRLTFAPLSTAIDSHLYHRYRG